MPLDAIAPLLGHASTVMIKTYAHWTLEAPRAETQKAAKQLQTRPALPMPRKMLRVA